MTDTRTRLTPGPDHPITVERWPGHVVVRSGSVVIAETDRALELREAAYPAVFYVPMGDVDQHHLRAQRAPHLVPVQGRGLLLRHRRRRRNGPDGCRLVLRRPLPRGRRDQGPRGLLRRPGLRHRHLERNPPYDRQTCLKGGP